MADAQSSSRRAEVQAFADVLTAEMPAGLDYHLLGSWCRQASTVGDLDVLVVTESGELGGNLFRPAVDLPLCFVAQRHGVKVAQGDPVLPNGDSMHIDFWSCRPRERGAYLMFATGPKELNLAQREPRPSPRRASSYTLIPEEP